MKILKCSKCGNVIHAFKNCLFCGNQSDFVTLEETRVHPNAQDDYVSVQEMVAKGDFISAEPTIDRIIRWSPSISEVRWLKLLIKNKCKNDIELLCKGFCADENAEYNAAIVFANETQKAVYSSIGDVDESIKIHLKKNADDFTSQVIIGLKIPQKRKEMQNFFMSKSTSLISKWEKIQQLEEMLKRYESDRRILTQEFIESALFVQKYMFAEKIEIDQQNEMFPDKYKIFAARFEAISNSSDHNSFDLIKQFKNNNQYVTEAESLTQQRQAIEAEIADEIRELHRYECELEELIRTVEQLSERCEAVKDEVNAGNYSPAHEFLGDQLFTRVLKTVLRFSEI